MTEPKSRAVGANPRRVNRPSQEASGLRQPPLDRADRPLEPARRLGVRESFEVAEQDRHAVFLGQSAQFVIQGREEFRPFRVGRRNRRLPRGGRDFAGSPLLGQGPCPVRHAPGHAVEPAAQRVVDPDHPRLADEDQECGLERVLNVSRVVQGTATDAEDHRAMAGHQGLEGRFRRVGRPGRGIDPFQQLGIAEAGGRPGGKEGGEMPQTGGRRVVGHLFILRTSLLSLYSMQVPGERI